MGAHRRKYYTARWALPGKPSLGNVSFTAASDHGAKRKADRVAKEIGLRKIPRTLTCEDRLVETLTCGMTWPS